MTALPRLLISGACVAAIGFGVYLWWTDRQLAARCSADPEVITLRDLITRGPGGNPYVTVVDFTGTDGAVQIHDAKTPNRYTDAWVPIVPPEEFDTATGRPVKVIVNTQGVTDAASLERWYTRTGVTGMVRDGIGGPTTSGAGDIVRQVHPGTDLRKCMYVNEGGKPPGSGGTPFLVGLAVFFALVAVGIWFFPRWPPPVEPHHQYTRRRPRYDRDDDRRDRRRRDDDDRGDDRRR